jgi:hypothetical protein
VLKFDKAELELPRFRPLTGDCDLIGAAAIAASTPI